MSNTNFETEAMSYHCRRWLVVAPILPPPAKWLTPAGESGKGWGMSECEDRKRMIVSGAMRTAGLMPSPYVEEAQGLGLLTSDLEPTPEWERVKHCILGTVSGETRDRFQRWCNMGKPRRFVEPKPIQAVGPLEIPLARLLPLPVIEEIRFEAAAVEGRNRSGVAFLRDGQPLDEAEIVWL